MITIDLPAAQAALKRVIEIYGADWVDRSHSYVPSGEGTGCLVGEALRLLEVPESVLRAWSSITLYALARKLEILNVATMTTSALEYLTMAQDVQDDGKTWGEAYEAAEELVVVA